MKRMILSAVVITSGLFGEGAFDLKVYERSLKQYIPWSLTGSAQDLRSDAKDHLQRILRAFVLLRPDAPWDGQQGPKAAMIADGFAGLKAYLAEKENEGKRPWVVDSIAYIVNTYIPEVQKLLETVNPDSLSKDLAAHLDAKKQLLKEFSQSIAAGQAELAGNSNREA